MGGDEIIWAQRLSYRISRNLDTETSPPYPESWRKGIPEEDFAADSGGTAWLWAFVSTVGVDEAKIIKYVQWQERQDSGQTKFDF